MESSRPPRFANRLDRLFGRESELTRLRDRPSRSGLTAIWAPPSMGKSWLLEELARRLSDDGGYVIGYHESVGQGSDMLHAVSNLYARWLSDSTLLEQARSLYERQKEDLVPRGGQWFGKLLEAFAKPFLPEGLTTLLGETFSALADVQKDLRSGGLQLAQLPHDQARTLVSLVAKLSGKKVVLILDAWGNSASSASELPMLEQFLKSADEWPTTHIFLGIRSSEADGTENPVVRSIRNLCRVVPSVAANELGPMNLADPNETARMLAYLRQQVPATQAVTDSRVLELIDGHPGVLYYWTDEGVRASMQTEEALAEAAEHARRLLYVDVERRLRELPDDLLRVAGRLAFFPRLNAERWRIHRALLLKQQDEEVVERLIDRAVLVAEDVPSYGHDIRHAMARGWFQREKTELFARRGDEIIESLASRITGVDFETLPFYEVLIACGETARGTKVSPDARCLLAAAFAIGDPIAYALGPDFDGEYPRVLQRNRLFAPLVMAALAIRGVSRSDQGDLDGAARDFSAIIGRADAKVDDKAFAYVQRGNVMGELGRTEEAAADYSAALSLPGISLRERARALVARGLARRMQGDIPGAMEDWNAVIGMKDDSASDFAAATLSMRGAYKEGHDDLEGAIEDYTTVIESMDAPAAMIAQALANRGRTRAARGEIGPAADDLDAALKIPDATAHTLASALMERAELRETQGDRAGPLEDYNSVIALPDAPAEEVAKALIGRAAIRQDQGDAPGAIGDLSAVLALTDIPWDQVAVALDTRGTVYDQTGEHGRAIDDYTTLVGMAELPTEQVARTLFNRALSRHALGDIPGAIEDFTKSSEIPEAPADVVADARDALEQLRDQEASP